MTRLPDNGPQTGTYIECSWPEDLSPDALSDFPDVEDVRRLGHQLLNLQSRADGILDSFQLHCMLVDDREIQALNARTRGKNQPTDVLSFPLVPFENGPGSSCLQADQEQGTQPISIIDQINWAAYDMLVPGPGEALALGDLVISYETCRKQAVEIGHSVSDEFWRLFIHGMLHLFGYDHETNAGDETRMQAREDQLWQDLIEF